MTNSKRSNCTIGALTVAAVLVFATSMLQHASAQSSSAQIWTDKDDYAPGEIVTISGSGFLPDSLINLSITHPDFGLQTWNTTSDNAGSFVTTYQLDGFAESYALSASDGENSATTTFTDANSSNSFSIAPSPVAALGTLTWSDTATCTGPPFGSNSCSSAGTSVGGPVPNAYTINVQHVSKTALSCAAESFSAPITDATTTPSAGSAGGTISAPSSSGSYCYRVNHPSQSISGVQWPTSNSNPVQIDVQSDSTPPVISYTVNGAYPAVPNGANGWYTINAIVDWTVSDAESAYVIDSGCVDTTISSDTAGTTLSCIAHSSGGASGPVSVTIMRDATAPTGVSGTLDRAPDHNGWYNAPVGVTFSGNDATSGIDSCDHPTYSGPDSATASQSGDCTDNAGNSASGSSPSFMYDNTDPYNIQFVGGPADSTSYYFGYVPSAPTCTAADTSSPPATCSISGYSTAVGSHTMTATAEDQAGNTATATRSYTVLAWTLNGFYQPVDMSPNAPTEIVWNSLKGGQTAPLKFEIFAGSYEFTTTTFNSTPIGTFKTQKVSCSSASVSTEDPIEMTTTGGTTFRYDASSGQFIQNWQTTKSMAGSCFTATFTAQDGSSLTAYFKIK